MEKVAIDQLSFVDLAGKSAILAHCFNHHEHLLLIFLRHLA
jgi:hypothetical protein